MIVVDASLAVKWMLWERESDEALNFLLERRGQLHAPDLLFIEVAGAIVRRTNQRQVTAADGVTTLDKWALSAENSIELHRATPSILATAGRLAINVGHPLKDCLYLALAMESDCELATCDAKFRDRVAASYPIVRLLSEYRDGDTLKT